MLVTNLVNNTCFDVEQGLDVVSAALRNNEAIGHSCRQGVCGSCSASIKSGSYSLVGGSSIFTIPPGEAPQKVLLCRVIPHSDITLEHTPPAEVERHAAQIFKLEHMTDDILHVTLKLMSEKSFDFEPGQFIGIRWVGSQLKYFSIANAPNDSAFIELHIRKQAEGGFTQWLFERATTSDVIGIDGPLGSFGWVTPADRPVILLATGTGFSPLKSLIEGLNLWNHPGGVHFYWGGRYKEDLYKDDLGRYWSSKTKNFVYEPILTRESPNRWTGRTGRIPEAVLKDHPDLSGFDVYACGSPEMIAQAKKMFVSDGKLSDERFFADAFESTHQIFTKPVVNIDIEFEKSQFEGRIRSEVGVTLLEALKTSGLNLDHYCGGGAVCATCRVNVGCANLDKPAEAETDLLECLTDLSAGDRLACQLIVTEALNNSRVRLPGRPSYISRLEE